MAATPVGKKNGPPPQQRPGGGDGGGADGRNGAPPRVGRIRPSLHFDLPPWAARLIRPRPPGTAIQFGTDRFTLVQVLPAQKGGLPTLAHLTAHTLPAGAVRPGLMEPNLAAPAAVAEAIGRALVAVPGRRKLQRISVVLPDSCGRVTLLTLRDLPRSSRQAAEMIRWQIRKRVPFKLEEARLAFQRFPLPDGSERVLVSLGLDAVLSQYERVLESLGLHPGLVDLATFNLANLLPAPPPSGDGQAPDRALLNATPEDFSLLILRRDTPLFYRSKSLIHAGPAQADALRRELQRELMTSITYYRDRLKGEGPGIGGAIVRVAPGLPVQTVELVREALGVEVSALAPEAVVTPRPGLEEAARTLLQQAAPALGVVVGRLVA